MAWTTPKTWATNDSLGASVLNTHIRDNENFLYGPPRCRVYNSANISCANGVFQALTFNSERFDNDTMHSTSTNTGRITATTAGAYLIGGSVSFAANTTGQRLLAIRLNGATYLVDTGTDALSSGASDLDVSTLYALAASDYVELMASQNSGGSLNATASSNYSPEFWAAWQGN